MKTVLIITIIIILFSSTFIINSAFAQSHTGVLKLDSIPSNFKEGGIITFSGTLTTIDGKVVSDALIYIKDDIDFDIDTVLGTVTTDENGKFSGNWKAVTRSSGNYDFYAVYEGGGNISSSRSVTQTVNVLSSGSSSSSDSSSYSTSTTYTPTKITLDKFINSAKTGEIVTFSGKLTANGQGLSGKTVWIKDEDAGDANDKLISAITDTAGKFSVNWKVKNTESGDRKFLALVLDFSGAFGGATQLNYIYNIAEASTVEIYAEFEGDNQYSKSNTCLFENVDGVLQENCNNRILLIQDDDSFKNLIVSTVLSEMGITSGSESLESILSNQVDSTNTANFEDILLESLQDKLNLGNTDLSMQEMLELLEDPSLAVNYNTVQPDTTTIPKTTPKINLDSDGDGIPDSLDVCDYQKETFNNYLDFDGCPDSKPTAVAPKTTTPTDLTKDSDGDGIIDILDSCKFQSETKNGYKDTDGCPDSKPTVPTQSPPTEWQTELKSTAVVTKTKVFSDKEYYIVNDEIFINGQTPSKIASVKIRIDDPNGNLVKLIQIPENGLNDFYTSIKIEKLWFTTSGKYTINSWTSHAEPDKDTLTVIISIPGSQPIVRELVPTWVKNNAEWWADGTIDDDSFTQGLQFLIKEKIIDVKPTSVNPNETTDIPSWVKNSANWWAQGLITEDDFLQGIEFLVENGIVKVVK